MNLAVLARELRCPSGHRHRPGRDGCQVSPTAVISTVKAAVLLAAARPQGAKIVSAKVTAMAQGVTKAMVLNKLKISSALLLAVTAVGAGIGMLGTRTLAGLPQEPAQGASVEGA